MNVNKAIQKLADVKDLMPSQDITNFLTAIIQARKEEAQSRVEMQKVQAAREVALEAIRKKHDLYRLVFDRIFDERRDAIAKHFDIIDRGIASGNQELILGGLKALAQIVAASPFSDLKALAQALEGGEKIEI